MIRFVTVSVGLVMLALAADAQSYRCENGELVGGNLDVAARCTVNSDGQITSVTPYATTTHASVKIYPNSESRTAPPSSYPTLTRPQPHVSKKRSYAPTPLRAQTQPAPAQIQRTYTPRTPGSVSPNGNVYYGAADRRSTQPRIISASQSPRRQASVRTAPCNFKVRELPARDNVNIFEVCYADIETRDRRSLSKLYSRIRKASRRACGTDYDSILTRWSRSNSQCVSTSVDRAVMSSDLAPLRAYHLAKTGKGIPTVYVGAPRDAY